MTTTSADPEDLGSFVTDGRRARRPVAADARSLKSLQTSVLANSPDYGVSSSNVQATIDQLENLRTNEQFVATIRDQLLEADVDPATGQPSIPNAAVAAALADAGLTNPPPPVQVEPGVLFGQPPTTGFVDDPICAANGNFVHVETDLHHPGRSAVLDVVRVYNSLAADRPGSFGRGWSSVLDLQVLPVDERLARVHLADGAVVPFAAELDERGDPTGTSLPQGTRPLRLVRVDDGWHLHEGDVKVWHFDGHGRFTGGTAGAARLEVVRGDDGRITALCEARSGRRVELAWQGMRVARATASDGRSAAYTYDDDGHLLHVDRPEGAVTYTVEGGRIAEVLDADGVRLAANRYDDDGRVLEQTNELGRTTVYTYSDAGTTLIADTNDGPRNALTHDRRGNVTSIIDGEGRALRLTYDDDSRVVAVRDRTGARTRYEHDEHGRLARRVDPDGLGQRWEWDHLGRLVAETHRNGAVTTYAYDGEHRRPSRITEPGGGTVMVELDEDDLPRRITDADGVAVTYEWDGDGQPVSITDALGHAVTFEYDAAGYLRRVVDAGGVATELQPDEAGRVLAAVVGGEPCATYEYTPAGRPVASTDAEGASWSARYGSHGRVLDFTDGEGSTVALEWDVLGNLAEVVAPDGERYRNHHDRTGRVVGATDPEGRRSELELDAEGRALRVVDPEGRTWRRELDALGRTRTSIAPDGARTSYRYHPVGTVAEVRGPLGGTTRTEVDDLGRVVALTDPTGGTYRFVWSPAGRLLERHLPSGRVERFAHDAAGRVVARTGLGPDERYELDGAGRPLAVTVDDETVRFTHNAAGEVVGAEGRDGTVALTRDLLGRVTSTVDGSGAGASYTYDHRGLVAGATSPDGLVTTVDRDVRGRIAGVLGPAGETTRYGYDRTGFLDSITDPTGTLRRVLDGSGRTASVTGHDGTTVDHAYDPAGRLQALVAGGETLASFTHDAAGRLTEARRGDAATAFEWDPAGRLLATSGPSGSQRFTRDADGLLQRLVSGDRTVDVERDDHARVTHLVDSLAGRVDPRPRRERRRDRAGRLTGTGDGTVHRYDAAGRLVETVRPDGRRWAMAYDADGHLAGEETPDGGRRYERGPFGRVERLTRPDGSVEAFTYDTAGRRVEQARSDGRTRRFEWDRTGALAAVHETAPDGTTRRLDVELDALGRPWRLGTDVVVWDDGLTGRPLQVGDRSYLNLGGAASVGTGTITWLDAPADPWGFTSDDAAPHVGFCGELEAWGLVWMGARVYDTASREFLSPDPLPALAAMPGAASGYAYAFQDPVNFVDPSGARPISQSEFDAYKEDLEKGTLGRSWDAITNDPWGTLALVGVVAVGTTLLFVPGGQLVGAGILIGVGSSTLVGVATGTFSPTDAAISGALGAIPGGSTWRSAIAVGAATNVGQEVVTRTIRGEDITLQGLTTSAVVGGGGGAAGRAIEIRIGGSRPRIETPSTPTVQVPSSPNPGGARFVVDSNGVVTDLAAGPRQIPSVPTRGGAGPVRQGAAGVQRTIDDLETAGGRVLGQEITLEAGGVRTRPDLFVELPNGQQAFLEVKTGASAGLTKNQTAAFPQIRSQGGIPRGANAEAAGFTPGAPIGPTPVWVVHQPWPLAPPL